MVFGLISITGLKHLSALLTKKFQRRPPFLHVFGRAPSDLQLCFVQLKTLAPFTRYSTFKYPVTLKPGLGSLMVIENYTSRSGTHDLLLTFHSNHRPISHRFRDKRQFQSKIANFSYPRVHIAPVKGSAPLEFGIRVRVLECVIMGLPEGRKSFKIGLVVLTQYRL